MYSLIRNGLFTLDPERAHHLTLSLLRAYPFFVQRAKYKTSLLHPTQCMGLAFPNPVGLAAGLDKDGIALKAWPLLGFGFVEVGTVTPKPQPGNSKPRLFRLTQDDAIINRMGFNNQGVDRLIERFKNLKMPCPVGINIGKNKDTPLEEASQDYSTAFEKVYAYADYVTVNLSSPNTPGLKALQHGEYLNQILGALKEQQSQLTLRYHKKVPIAVKISPDMNDDALATVVAALLEWEIEAVIATNTTVERPASLKSAFKNETGGLSGAPLFEHSTAMVKAIFAISGKRLPIIAVGGIMNAAQAKAKWDAGATLIQLYSGFIYRGPSLIKDILKSLPASLPRLKN